MSDLFARFGANFSPCRKYRFALWRIWDTSKPLVMFIGLNPSTANETEADPTIKSVIRIAKHNGFGGVYMMNCYPMVSTDPSKLLTNSYPMEVIENELLLVIASQKCSEVVFAWGNFKVVQDTGRDQELIKLFPNAKAIAVNKNGSPKHPLYCRSNSPLVPFRNHG